MKKLLQKRIYLSTINRKKGTGVWNVLMLLFAVFHFSSCEKEEIPYEDCAGILSCKLQFEDGRVFECKVDQTNETISNSVDSIFFNVNRAYLKKMRIFLTNTRDAEITIEGTPVVSGETILDLSSGKQIVVSYKNVQKEYSLFALVEKLDHSKTSGNRINSDMTLTGLPIFNYYSAAYFNGEYYIFGSRFPQGNSAEGIAYYELYKSPDAGRWTKVDTNIAVMGGYGANLITVDDQLFLVGGMRLWGKDIEGNPAPDGWSIAWRMYATKDGVNWRDCTKGQSKNPGGCGFMEVTAHNGKLFARRGKSYMWGTMMNAWSTSFYATEDGTNWERINTTDAGASALVDGAFFSYDNKLWLAGGYRGWVNASKISGDVWSSSDEGLSWTKVASDVVDLKRVGMRAVTYGNKVYVIAGSGYNSEGVLGGIVNVMASSDGINWENLEDEYKLPLSFKERIIPSVFNTEGNTFAIIGGYEKPEGNYMIKGLGMLVRNDVWIKRINLEE